MTSLFRITFLTVTISLLLGACATQPYAEVSGDRGAGRADQLEESVRILGVDGRAVLNGSLSETVEPGQRLLMLGSTRRGPRGTSGATLVPLNAKPCMHYHFLARHESMTMVEPWTLVLSQVEPMPECLKKFPASAQPPLTKGPAPT